MKYNKLMHPIPGPSPPEGKGTSAAGGMGFEAETPNEGATMSFDLPRHTRDLLIEQARHMRKHPTQAEGMFWDQL